MTMTIHFDDTGATLRDGDEIIRVFAWSREGGHVSEIIYGCGEPYRQNVTYRGSTNTILTEDTPAATAAHIADLCGVPRSAIVAA